MTRKTPCATCGGTGEQIDTSAPLTGLRLPCVMCKGSGIAPCGVETPEAAVEAFRTHQPKPIYRAVKSISRQSGMTATEWRGDGCTCGWTPDGVRTDEFYQHQAAALIAQGWTPPGGPE